MVNSCHCSNDQESGGEQQCLLWGEVGSKYMSPALAGGFFTTSATWEAHAISM